MLTRRESYDETREAFRWDVPERFNIGVDITDRWARRDPSRTALIDVAEDGTATHHDFATLSAGSNRLAGALAALGLGRSGDAACGDRIGVLLPQCVETVLAHAAISKTGAVAVPLFTLFGPEALEHRMGDCGMRALITDRAGYETVRALLDRLPALETVICTEPDVAGTRHLEALVAEAPEAFEAVDTAADDPAILIYTSGTSGNPKGALHAHRVLLGHLPGVEMSHNFLPREGDRLWSPADWAWIGGLLDVMMPALHHGVTLVACRFRKFTALAAADLIERHAIRNAFLPPTALKMMRQEPRLAGRRLAMRSVASGGETLGPELLDWGREVFGVTINEFYGQTECNMIVSACAELEAPEPGAMGRPVPGHRTAVIDPATGEETPAGQEGEIAVAAPDPVMFLGYWGKPDATAEKFVDGPDARWLLTGDRGRRLEDGRLVFVGRADDVISSAGYRIGPAEVEDCLIRHPAVSMAGVVGAPDPLRGSVVVAFVTLAEGHAPGPELEREIAEHVKRRLAAHEYPRAVRFVDRMPMTATGKIIRAELREMVRDGIGVPPEG